MPIVVETGSGRDPLAVSYATVDGASLYFGSSMDAENWDDLDLLDQERALVTASRLLDSLMDWKGTQVYPDQPLAWPRRSVRDPSGRVWPYNAVPTAVRNATAALALQLASNPETASAISSDTSSTTGDDALKRVKLGSLEIEYQAASSTTTTTQAATTASRSIPVSITAMLKHWGNYASGGAVMGRVTR